jgi:RIO kinase 1
MPDDDDATIHPALEAFLARGHITEVLGPLKSGKEATVYACRAGPSAGCAYLAAKVHRAREDRSFKNDAVYQEGQWRWRAGGRPARAFATRTRFGREVQAAAWLGHEWEVLRELHAAGVPVPRPVDAADGAILMELFGDEDGAAAPPLRSVSLAPEEATRLHARLVADIERMLRANIVHGDLSPYNILYRGGEYRIIDFPQAVDPRFNGSATLLLARDLENVARYLSRFAPCPDPTAVARDLWARWFAAS